MDNSGQQEALLFFPNANDVVATRGGRSHVGFIFSFHHIICEYYDNVLLTQTVHRDIMTKSVHVDIKQFDYSRQIINEELRDWPLDDCRRGYLSKLAFDIAKIIVPRLMSPQNNVLIIPYRVVVISNRPVLDENLAMSLIAQRSMEEFEADSVMVPATDSSVESLKMRTTTSCHEDGESCSICLEDFRVGCEVLYMPCSHNFHGNCIKKWLEYSHYCPICRFEMPTKT